MKKRLLILVGFLLYFSTINAQSKDSNPQVFVGNAAVDFKSTTTLPAQRPQFIQMQIGGALPYSRVGNTANNVNVEVGFPYNIQYIPSTFSTEDFEISKGYFTESVRIKWRITANQDRITSIQIKRRVLGDASSTFKVIANLNATTFEFNDSEVDGGVLFEYQVIAVGVETNGSGIGERAVNYMDGIGYRNPTANVSGSVSFDSGSPVQDVKVSAEALGAENSVSKSVYFPQGQRGNIIIPNIENISADNFTVQAWISTTFGSGLSLLINSENSGKYDFYVGRNSPNFNISDVAGSAGSLEMGNLIPSGKIDAAGNDAFTSISNFGTWQFVHLTIVFEQGEALKYFINGREINESYIQSLNGTAGDAMTLKYDDDNKGKNYKHQFPDTDKITNITIQNTNRHLHVDEFRVWNKVLTAEEIRRDYRRTLGGGENGLAVYLRMDEGAGNFLYDLSKVGFNQNKNDGVLNGQFQFIDRVPTSEQLGVFGVTDVNGSYIISGIPYKGTGESFVISPSLGKHKFEPASQTLFLGTEESVVNQVNFKDISSFKFNGRAIYDVRGVFNPIATTNPTDVREGAYNQYVQGSIKINKGQYYYEDGAIDPADGIYKNGVLNEYPVIGLEGANVLVDGNIVYDEDNQPVLTAEDGTFTISVPIGNHRVEVQKNGHTFSLNGRFPETSTFSFFEDQIETRYFIDETRISLVGKVVGGRKEFEKPIGFGFNGKREYVSNEGEIDEIKEIISSNNNIGTAQITFKGDLNIPDLDKIIVTNSETGEYKVELIPYQYSILQSGIIIPSNSDVAILNSTESIDLRDIPELETSEFTAKDGQTLVSDSYHYEKSFRYNSNVSLILINQEHENELTIGTNSYDISDLSIPIYNQRSRYDITFEIIQKYINKDDGSNPIETKEFVTDGSFSITNNLASEGVNAETISAVGNKYIYTFAAGTPNITKADGFKEDISIQYIIAGKNPIGIENLAEFKSSGIIKGGKSSGGKTFVTSAPQLPSIILRDPPGTNSFASIERGTTISYEENRTNTESTGIGGGYRLSIGPNVSFNAGIFSNSIESVVETTGAISTTTEEIDVGVTKNTYTFNETISTSNDPSYVGAQGDLFIGNAKNVYYGIFDNMYITENIPLDNNQNTIPNISISVLDANGNATTLYVSSYKDYFIAEQPTNTYFSYSQKFILETLIPQLEVLAANPSVKPQTPVSHRDETRTSEFYTAQANLWRKVIQNNEKAKYDALANRDALKDGIVKGIARRFNEDQANKDLLGDLLGTDFSPSRTFDQLNDLLDKEFYTNRSFDSGLGEFTSSVTSTVLVSNSYQTVVDTSGEFQTSLGLFVNDVGASINMTNTFSAVSDNTNTDLSEETTTISYTLKDNDRANLLSVDVVNLFDGSGPVFITRGGATSCPYEGEVKSQFFNVTDYATNSATIGRGGVVLSEATNKVYNVEIGVKRAKITNIPESEAAVFVLLLKNTSETQSDLEFVLNYDDNTLTGGEISLETNGTNIFLPYNETIEFPVEISKSSSSSIFKFDNIKLQIYSPCATFAEKRENFVDVSVEFKKSCSNVTVSAPENNWVFNANEAYSLDVEGETINNKLPITFTDFNTDFNGFERISLQYRNASAANWVKLQSYYGSQALKDASGDNDAIVITRADADFTYNWDVVGDKIPDGNYEFRAVSFCADNITNTSEIISGIINLNAPVVFGTPKPTDGILDVGEDISLRFNEPIFERITTNITVTGFKNQQEIDHSVFVKLDGSNNQIELPNQLLKQNSSLTLQFWYHPISGKGNLVTQENGFNVAIDGNQLEFTLGEQTVKTDANGLAATLNRFNFYSFVYQKRAGNNPPLLLIHENGTELKKLVLNNDLDINTSKPIFIGGQNVIGNIHDVRMWARTFTEAQANVAKNQTLTGRELNLTGYWKLDEGFGALALDKAKRKNAKVNLGWDIKPKGTGYVFENSEFLTLDNVNFVQVTNTEDVTLSFWIKPDGLQEGTIFSNGFGDEKEAIKTNGFRNKWSINMDKDGGLELQAEDTTYPLTTTAIANQQWTHVAIVLKRGGTLNSYINGEEVSSVSSVLLGGITGNKFLIGARLFEDFANNEFVDNHYTGLLDELRLWNTARSIEQIKRDRYFEIDHQSTGLILYTDFNQNKSNLLDRPRYSHKAVNETIGSTFAVLNTGADIAFTDDSPALKPKQEFTNIPFSTVINGDEMIIQPNLTNAEWSLFEGEIINFSVTRLSDTHFNTQLSPVTWSALVNRQELEWFTEDQSKEIVTEKIVGDSYSFTMDIVNVGGSNQPFTVSGLPTWLKAEATSGSVAPNSNKQITFTVDLGLAAGNYTADIFLETNSGFNDRLSFNLRVLTPSPDWSVNAVDYTNSMNFIGRIQIDNVFSRDEYTKVGAFVNDEPRGEAYLKYDAAFDSYFVFLTAYSNIPDSNVQEKVTFKIWDAINGKIIVANIDNATEVDYLINGIEGTKSSPKIFSSTILAEQNLALNKGWTWVSLYANDSKLLDITQTFGNLNLVESDGIKSQTEFSNFKNGFWDGNLTQLSVTEMYKIKLGNANQLRLLGTETKAADFDINIDGKSVSPNGNTSQWNWLPFPVHRDIALEEALAFYQATDGDVIKDQFNFAIYDATSGWSGTLSYLQSGRGYMLNSAETQTFNYPDANVLLKTVVKQVASKTNTNDFAQYSSNMNIVAEVIADENFTKVLVFDGDNVLRGSADIVDLNDKKISFITAFSNTTELLKFVLANDTEQIDINKNFMFIDNLVMGDLKNPLKLTTSFLSTESLLLNDAVLYPNPFTSEITIDLSRENTRISKVEIFNTIGVSLISKTKGFNQKTTINTANLAKGIYLIRLTDTAGKSVIKKMIKE